MNQRSWTAVLFAMVTALLLGCNSSSSSAGGGGGPGGSSGDSGGNTQVYDGTYVGLGPLAPGATVEFYELDPMTGQRTTGDAVAQATVDERGAYTLPDFTTRWVEVVASEDYLDLYTIGTSYTEDAPAQVSAILDTEDTAQGRNVQLFTHLIAERAKWLLLNSQSESVDTAMARAHQEFSDDWALNLPAAAVHFFHEPEAPVTELDDYAKLLAASSYVSRYLPDDPMVLSDLASDYAQSRLTLEDGPVFELADALSTRSDFYASRAISRMNRVFRDEDRPMYWQLFARTLSGCEATKAFNSQTIVCLGEDRDNQEVVIPSGEGTYTKTLYFHPRASGMWALEVATQEQCDVNWTSYLGDSSTAMTSDSTTERSSHKLVSPRRLTPGLYRLEVRVDRDDCLAQSANLSFRKVALGSDTFTAAGTYYLERGGELSGVVGTYETLSGDVELSSSRSYLFYANASQASAELEFTIDFDTSGAVEFELNVEEYITDFGGRYIGIGADSRDNSVGQLKEVYTLAPQTIYRIWIDNVSADVASTLDDYRSTNRRHFELTIQ